MLPRLAAARVSAARPPPEMQTFSARVLRGQPLAVEPVVEGGDGLAQLPEAGDRRVLLVVGARSDDVRDARRRAGQLAGLGLALTEVAPLGIARRKAELRRLARDVDDAGSRDRAKTWNGRVAHGRSRYHEGASRRPHSAFSAAMGSIRHAVQPGQAAAASATAARNAAAAPYTATSKRVTP